MSLLRKQLPRAKRVCALRRTHEHGGRLAEASQFCVWLHNAELERISGGAQPQHRDCATRASPRDLGAEKPLGRLQRTHEVDDGGGSGGTQAALRVRVVGLVHAQGDIEVHITRG